MVRYKIVKQESERKKRARKVSVGLDDSGGNVKLIVDGIAVIVLEGSGEAIAEKLTGDQLMQLESKGIITDTEASQIKVF